MSELSFTVKPGVVTGFLGPNGSGKSTTMRLILGLDAPDTGHTRVNGKPYRDHPAPLHEVGSAARGALGAHRALRLQPPARARADPRHPPLAASTELIDLVGLQRGRAQARRPVLARHGPAARHRRRRCSAIPDTVMLDEPVNGLDPEGIQWVRNLLKGLAAEGRTVFVSSHLMSEMALTAEHLIVIGRGRADRRHERRRVRPRARQPARSACARRRPAALTELVAGPDVSVDVVDHGLSRSPASTPSRSARCAAKHGIVLHELTPQRASLEEAFMELTRDAVEFQAESPDARRRARGGAGMSAITAAAGVPARQSHPGSRRALRVDEAALAALDALVAVRGAPPDHRHRGPGLHRVRESLAAPRPRRPGCISVHLRVTLAGVNLAQLAIGVLGVLVITAEYSTGMIRSTFSAVPEAAAGAVGQGSGVRAR